MPTVKFYEKLSKSEHNRVNELYSEIKKHKKLESSDIFNSKEIPKMLNGITANLHDSTDWKNLHFLVPFYKTIISIICPYCPTRFDDIDYKLIEYYLDKQIILPVIGDYELYPSKFIDLILQYPHTTVGAVDMNLINNNLSLVKCTCKNCLYGDGYKFVEDYIKNNSGKNLNQSLKLRNIRLDAIKGIWHKIRVIEHNKYYTNNLVSVINTKSQTNQDLLIGELLSEVNYTYDFLTSKSLNANYVLDFDNVIKAKEFTFNRNNEVFLQYPEFQKLILQGLHLYIPKEVPDVNYIDLLIDNKEKIQNIVKLIPENYLIDTNYIKMRTIFDDLNEEVKSLSSSKRATFLNFSTNFISLNFKLLKSGILKLCGYKDVNFDTPAFEDKFKDKTIDYFSEKILPIYLQKPLPIIQLWKLQKKVLNEKAKNA